MSQSYPQNLPPGYPINTGFAPIAYNPTSPKTSPFFKGVSPGDYFSIDVKTNLISKSIVFVPKKYNSKTRSQGVSWSEALYLWSQQTGIPNITEITYSVIQYSPYPELPQSLQDELKNAYCKFDNDNCTLHCHFSAIGPYGRMSHTYPVPGCDADNS